MLSISPHAAGWRRAEALQVSEELGRCDRQRCTGDLNPGLPTVLRAEIAALLGDRDGAVALLRQVYGVTVIAAPQRTDLTNPHYHFLFESLRGYPPFEELLRPKG